ncbi:hypothetical protein BaRGS_00003690 [Batillaria attramentaria]|uniref:Uncharacterized protein n=1 Tax=Batillaria attramentaria TaxID=370345 RepID=A0ABD0M021_9CAEN
MLSSDRNETRGHTAAISRDMAEAKSYIPALGSGVNTSPTDHGRPANRMEELHHLYPQVFNRLHRRQMLSAEQSPSRSVFNHRMSRVQSHHEGGGDEVCGRGGEEYGAKVASRKSRRKRYFIGEFTGFVEDPLQVPSTDSSSVEIPKPFEDAAGDTGRTRSKHRHWPFNTSVPHHSIVEDEPSAPQYAQSRKFISGLYDESCEPSCADESIATLNYPSNKGQDDEISRLLSYSDSSFDESAAVRLPSVDSALDGTLGDSQDLTEDAGKPADVKYSGRRSSGQWGVQDEKEGEIFLCEMFHCGKN